MHSKPEKDDVVVLCIRVEDGPSAVPGSTKKKCCKCLRQVWLSPATISTLEKTGKDYELLCTHCGEPALRENRSKDDRLMLPSPEQLREIVKSLAERN